MEGKKILISIVIDDSNTSQIEMNENDNIHELCQNFGRNHNFDDSKIEMLSNYAKEIVETTILNKKKEKAIKAEKCNEIINRLFYEEKEKAKKKFESLKTAKIINEEKILNECSFSPKLGSFRGILKERKHSKIENKLRKEGEIQKEKNELRRIYNEVIKLGNDSKFQEKLKQKIKSKSPKREQNTQTEKQSEIKISSKKLSPTIQSLRFDTNNSKQEESEYSRRKSGIMSRGSEAKIDSKITNFDDLANSNKKSIKNASSIGGNTNYLSMHLRRNSSLKGGPGVISNTNNPEKLIDNYPNEIFSERRTKKTFSTVIEKDIPISFFKEDFGKKSKKEGIKEIKIVEKKEEKKNDKIEINLNSNMTIHEKLYKEDKENKEKKEKTIKSIIEKEFTFSPKISRYSGLRKESSKEFLDRISVKSPKIKKRELSIKSLNSPSCNSSKPKFTERLRKISVDHSRNLHEIKIEKSLKDIKMKDHSFNKCSFDKINHNLNRFKIKNLQEIFELVFQNCETLDELNQKHIPGISEKIKEKMIIPTCQIIKKRELEFNFQNFYFVSNEILKFLSTET